MNRLLGELLRRNALRVAAAYLIVARPMVTINSLNQRWHSDTYDPARAMPDALTTQEICP